MRDESLRYGGDDVAFLYSLVKADDDLTDETARRDAEALLREAKNGEPSGAAARGLTVAAAAARAGLRPPSWCDRIVTVSLPGYADDLRPVDYASLVGAVKGSDHRAVGCAFSLRCDASRCAAWSGRAGFKRVRVVLDELELRREPLATTTRCSQTAERHAVGPDVVLNVEAVHRCALVFPLPAEDPRWHDRTAGHVRGPAR